MKNFVLDYVNENEFRKLERSLKKYNMRAFKKLSFDYYPDMRNGKFPGEIISKNKDLLELIANTLLEYETLTKEQIDYLVKNGKMPEEDDETSYEKMSVTKLKEIAKEKGIKGYSKMSKAELLKELDEANH